MNRDARGVLRGGKAETVLPDAGVGVNRDAIANDAIVIDNDIGIKDAVPADGGPWPDEHTGIENASLADLCRGIDKCGRMNALMWVPAIAVKHNQRAGKRVVGILRFQQR